MPPTHAPRRPRVFVGSSTEGLPIARALQVLLDHTCEVEVWDQGVFEPGGMTLPSLIEAAHRFDFAIFVVSPDDITDKRGSMKQTPRDNVIFELGLFMGTVGPSRSFMVHERDSSPDLPSDLAGVTRVTFHMHSTGNVRASLGAAGTTLEEKIRRTGPIQPRVPTQWNSHSPIASVERSTQGAAYDRRATEPSDAARVEKLVQRWVSYAPANEARIRAVLDGLRGLGYAVTPAESRSGGSDQTYVRVLRPDGRNVGYMNSSSFVFLGKATRSIVAESETRRYSWSEPDSVDVVLHIAGRLIAP